ncbi:MAG: hypothetical protein NC095_01190 [Muribaculum sp.]|nr:hypothetical protein [Muribaculum sp.]
MIFGILVSGCHKAASRNQDADSSLVDYAESIYSLHPEDVKALHWADSVMSAMTLEQMAGQLIFPAVYSDDSDLALRSVVSYVADSHVGGVVLLKGTPKAARAIADTLGALSCAPPFVAIDAEWGLAMRLSDTPRFPRNGNISPAAEDSILYEYGLEVARECREVGINMVLGPVLDVVPGGTLNKSFIGSRSFGSDPIRVALLGVAYSQGLEEGGVMSVAKHFPGHGSADGDSHKHLPYVAKNVDELRKCDLLPFDEYVRRGLSGIMVGHLYVPALDSIRRPISVSNTILRDMMRGEMEFEGLIITDAMNMTGAEGNAGAEAIMAGADIVLAPSDTRKEVQLIVSAVKAGSFAIEDLRDRVRRVLIYKYRFRAEPRMKSEDNSKHIQRALLK